MANQGSTQPFKASPPKTHRQSYNVIHANPLPITVWPLPPLIPHNPVSVLYVGFVYLKQLLFPPQSVPSSLYTGWFSTETCSVHVTDESSVLALWRSGFFGKGLLSRSEPTWLDREKRRLGVTVNETAEEITAKRRAERKVFKQERARKAREEIEAQQKAADVLKGEPTKVTGATKGVDETTPLIPTKQLEADTQQESVSDTLTANGTPTPVNHNVIGVSAPREQAEEIMNQEHLQLELVEAFFLQYALGIFAVTSPDVKSPISTLDFFKLCLAHAAFPPQAGAFDTTPPAPDNRFIVNYVAYHHFRSLGWVVRSGVKFGVDLLLYNRGPVFAHAEFAVCVVPAYSHSYWQSTEAAARFGKRKGKPWHWLHMVNRVQSQVRKTLVICFVEIAPPMTSEVYDDLDITRLLKSYEVRELVVKRWVPNRSRD